LYVIGAVYVRVKAKCTAIELEGNIKLASLFLFDWREVRKSG
jgi:hypothetical protein